MQTRVSFNGGEYAPEMETRADLEKYALGCELLENWEVGQLGGLKRRRGMRKIADALSGDSHIIPFVYSYADVDDVRFLVEIAPQVVRVLDMDGGEVARFESGALLVEGDDGEESEYVPEFLFNPGEVRAEQLNKLLILTSLGERPMVLKYDGGLWEFEPFEFRNEPWRYEDETRDAAVTVKWTGEAWSVTFDDEVDASESADTVMSADKLRVSYWTDQAESKASSRSLRNNVAIVSSVPEAAARGQKFAVKVEDGIRYYVCTADFKGSSYVAGLESPANYTSNFLVAENLDGFDGVTPVYSIHEVNGGGDIAKGTKIAIYSSYWHYFTCVEDFDGKEEGYDSFEDYPAYFVKGLAVGDALPCGGAWSFYCSGTWYGCYEVRRNYDTPDLSADWELRGTSFSRNDNASNVQPSGTEADDECYLRLFLTMSRCMGSAIDGGFPGDTCYNRLIVESYKHHITLKASPVNDGSVLWSCDDLILPEPGSTVKSRNWSWSAFSARNGYPLLCETYESRLVFASTIEQPQTVWMSRTDDLNNFLVGDTDASAIVATLNTPSQNPICWLAEQRGKLLLGTSAAEFVLSPRTTGGTVTKESIGVNAHSYVGSLGEAGIAVENKILYIGRGGWNVYEYGYNWDSDGYVSRNISLLAPHIGKSHGGIVRGAAVSKPDDIAMFVLGDGQLALCTYNSVQQVMAWNRWVTEGKIKDVCSLADGRNRDKVYLLVERDGRTQIEVVDDESPFVDDGGRDYESVFITNTLRSPLDELVRNAASAPFSAFFNSGFSLREGTVLFTTNGGESWFRPNDSADSWPRGWKVNIVAQGSNGFSRKIGMRVSGDRDAEILAIQG